jgi:ribosome-binding factor A
VHKRATRVAQLIQKEIAGMLVNEVKDPRIGFTTVTEVRLTDDLKSAKVFVSVYGSDEQRENSLRGLRAAGGYMRREIAHRLKLRETPQLTFEIDTSLDTASRIESLLTAVSHGKTEAPDPRDLAPLPVQIPRNERVLENIPERAQRPRKGGGRKGRGRNGRGPKTSRRGERD